jgi:hypothetical protein
LSNLAEIRRCRRMDATSRTPSAQKIREKQGAAPLGKDRRDV